MIWVGEQRCDCDSHRAHIGWSTLSSFLCLHHLVTLTLLLASAQPYCTWYLSVHHALCICMFVCIEGVGTWRESTDTAGEMLSERSRTSVVLLKEAIWGWDESGWVSFHRLGYLGSPHVSPEFISVSLLLSITHLLISLLLWWFTLTLLFRPSWVEHWTFCPKWSFSAMAAGS